MPLSSLKQADYRYLGAAFLAAPLMVIILVLTPLSQWQWPVLWPNLFLATLVFPVCEEVIFRGLIQGELLRIAVMTRRFAGISIANLLTSALFSIGHALVFGSLMALLVLPASMIFGGFYDRYRSVYLPIFLHGWYNFSAAFYSPLW